MLYRLVGAFLHNVHGVRLVFHIAVSQAVQGIVRGQQFLLHELLHLLGIHGVSPFC